MTSTTDIGNRALQLIGTRTTMASLTESSNEAAQINLVFSAIQSWCSGLANWNFARSTALLTQVKGPPGGSPPTWSSTYPSPGWNYEYTLPSDFIRAIYLTDSLTSTTGRSIYTGEPKRFQMAVDTISSVQQEVLLTNESIAILIYTALIANPTIWPWYFERLMVIMLAKTVCMPLVGDKKLLQELNQDLEQQIQIALQANTIEGLIIQDTTPEWIQALGINYPFRRIDGLPSPQPPQPQQRTRGRDDQ